MHMNNKKYKIGYTTGVYDMFHIGHLNILKRAKEQCDYLIVGVTTDELCFKRKNKYPIICESDRMAIVAELRCVDQVVPQENMDKLEAVKQYGANAVLSVPTGKEQMPGTSMKESLQRLGVPLFTLNIQTALVQRYSETD